MKNYIQDITLNKNARGCYILDTVKGCSSGLKNNPSGCYGECYACKIANRYQYDFSRSIVRKFEYEKKQLFLFGFRYSKQLETIVKQIRNIDMPFIRIGEMGDPSEAWEHTIDICKEISCSGKKIVIVTKHWDSLTDKMLKEIESMDICINTSISALDSEEQICNRLWQFHRLSGVCKSVLRIVSCDFNKNNETGLKLYNKQVELFKHGPNIDTILRLSENNELVKNSIVNISKVKFLRSEVCASILNKYTYFGHCKDCPEMCGINI